MKACQYENMNMNVDTADSDSSHIMILQYPADVSPNPFLNVERDESHTVLDTENNMDKNIANMYLPSTRPSLTRRRYALMFRGLKPTAKFG